MRTALSANVAIATGYRDFFYEHLRKVSANYDSDFSYSESSGCVTIGFEKSRENFLDYLTLYENAPTVPREDGFEDGLGAFAVKKSAAGVLTLARKRPIRRGYNEIIYYEYRGDADPHLNDKSISDFNRISDFDIPEWVKREYREFDNIQLNAVNLMINHRDEHVRDLIYNCLDVDKFRRAFVPKRTRFYDIQTVFPLGVPGAFPGKPKQVCGKARQIVEGVGPLHFANWRYDNYAELSLLFKEFRKKTGVEIVLDNYSAERLMQVMFNKPRPYNLVVIVFDSVRPQETVFLEAFFRKEGYHDRPLEELRPVYQEMVLESNPERRMLLSKQLAEALKDKRLVLPLYQNIGSLYYPRKIKNLEVGKEFLEYPEIADFRW